MRRREFKEPLTEHTPRMILAQPFFAHVSLILLPRSSMRSVHTAVLISLLLACGLASARDTVELDYRLQPERNLVSESVTDGITTIRIREDRGLVAKAAAKGVKFPHTMHIVKRQHMRHRTGPREGDGSFAAEMLFLGESTHLKLPDGNEQVVPEKLNMKDVQLKARIKADGSIPENTITVEGGDPSSHQFLRPILVSVLQQAANIPAVRIQDGVSSPQDVSLQIPVPGLATLSLKMRIFYKLLEVVNGVARVEMLYVLEFDSPTAGFKLKADGSGGGVMLYEMATRTALSIKSTIVMTFVADTPEGVIEVRMNTQQSQSTKEITAR